MENIINHELLTYEEVREYLDEIAEELPEDFYKYLNGGELISVGLLVTLAQFTDDWKTRGTLLQSLNWHILLLCLKGTSSRYLAVLPKLQAPAPRLLQSGMQLHNTPSLIAG